MSIADIEALRTNIGFWDVKDQLKTHVYARSKAAFEAGDAARDSIHDLASLRERQLAMRAAFIESLGGLPSSDSPLAPVITGVIEEAGFRIEKVIYRSRPGVYVTANLYVPAGVTKRTGAVLFLSGHWREARLAEEYQVVCRHLVSAGLVVLAPDPVGQGERWSYWERSLGAPTVDCGTSEHDYAGAPALLLGDAIARYFVHDAMRGIDYLASRPEVDPGRIGVTGNSGGGTQTCLMMVCDPRIAAAAPATFIMNRETYQQTGGAQDAEQIWTGMSAIGFDHEDVLLAMVPRPVLVLAVSHDFFPIEGTRRTVERTRRFWELAGAADNIELHVEDVEHHYTASMAARAAEFFSRHLNGKAGSGGKRPPAAVRPDSSSIHPIAQRDLWCTKSGQVRGEIEGAIAVQEGNCVRLTELEAARRSMGDAALRDGATRWLRERVFKDRKPGEANVRHLREWLGQQHQGLSYRLCLWWSQPGLMSGAALFRDYRRDGERLPLTIGLWQHGTGEISRHLEWIRDECAGGRAVLVLDLSGYGMLEPNAINGSPKFGNYGTMHKLAHDLVWLDDSLPALRCWELIRALDVIGESFADLDSSDIRVHSFGRVSVYAEIAAFLDPRIRRLETHEGLESFAELVRSRHYDEADINAVIMPGALRHFDLPDLRRWRAG